MIDAHQHGPLLIVLVLVEPCLDFNVLAGELEGLEPALELDLLGGAGVDLLAVLAGADPFEGFDDLEPTD